MGNPETGAEVFTIYRALIKSISFENKRNICLDKHIQKGQIAILENYLEYHFGIWYFSYIIQFFFKQNR